MGFAEHRPLTKCIVILYLCTLAECFSCKGSCIPNRRAPSYVPAGSSVSAWLDMSRSGHRSMHFNVPNQRSGAHTCSGKHSPTTPIHACSSCTLLSAHRRSTTCGKMNQSSFWFRCCAKKSWTSALCSGKHGATTTARAYLLCTLVSAFQTVFIMVVNMNGVQLVPCGILRDHQSSLPTWHTR